MEKYEPLFLKYRPQALGDLVGQKFVAKTLSNAIEANRISHAYLFTGPRGTGKTSSARILAKSLNCVKGPTVTPCQECASCMEIKQGSSSSVFEIDAASNNSVDDARLLIERAPLVAQGGRFKIYIIDECHMLTKEAFNALLKTIEEPPPNVIFVLATTEEQKVPPTIVSRCQRLIFRLVNHADLIEHLAAVAQKENINIQGSALEFVARRSGGGMRDALGLLDQASLLSSPGQAIQIEDLLHLIGSLNEDLLTTIGKTILDKDGEGALNAVTALVHEGRESHLIAAELAKHFLNLAKASYMQDPEKAAILINGSIKYVTELIAVASGKDRSELSQIVEFLDGLEQTCKRASQPVLHLEVGILSLCHRLEIAETKNLKTRLSALETYVYEDSPPPPKALQGTVHKELERPTPKPVPAEKPAPPAPIVVPSDPSAQAGTRAPTQNAESTYAESTNAEPTSAPAQEEPSNAEPTNAEPTAGTSESNYPVTTTNPVVGAPADSIAAAVQPVKTESEPDVPRVSVSIVEDEELLMDESVEKLEQESPAAVSVASVRAPEPGKSVSQEDSDYVSDSVELDEIWSALLDELQKRNIPTFSLVSTHAFPVSLTSRELTAGVMVEHFQKMIEAKIEHVKASLAACTGKSLHVKIRIVTPEARGESNKTKKPQRERQTADAPQASAAIPPPARSLEFSPLAFMTSPPVQEEIDENSESLVDRGSFVKKASTVIQEAYKVFEGPGSRLITSG